MRPEVISFLRKEAKAIHKTLPPNIGITKEQVLKQLKQNWKEGNRLKDDQMTNTSVENYQTIIIDEAYEELPEQTKNKHNIEES